MRYVDLFNDCNGCLYCLDITYGNDYAYGRCLICGQLWSNDGKYISCRQLSCPGHSDNNEPKKD